MICQCELDAYGRGLQASSEAIQRCVQVDILCTHPMFGPDSGKGSWQGLNFMYECVRVGRSPERQQRVKNVLKVDPS